MLLLLLLVGPACAPEHNLAQAEAFFADSRNVGVEHGIVKRCTMLHTPTTKDSGNFDKCFDVVGGIEERKAARENREEDDPRRPDVYFYAITRGGQAIAPELVASGRIGDG